MPTKTTEVSPSKCVHNMESNLVSLQQKIADLESKLQLTHTELESETKVKFNSQAFKSLYDEIPPKPRKTIQNSISQQSLRPKSSEIKSQRALSA
jgi:hypothetical protein